MRFNPNQQQAKPLTPEFIALRQLAWAELGEFQEKIQKQALTSTEKDTIVLRMNAIIKAHPIMHQNAYLKGVRFNGNQLQLLT